MIDILNNITSFYSVEDIGKILKISRSMSYKYIKEVYKDQKPFKVIKVGKMYRVNQKSFDNWINEVI